MGFFDKFKAKQVQPPVQPARATRRAVRPEPVTELPPMDPDHFTPRLTVPDGPLVGPHVYRVPMTYDNSQTISHKGLDVDWEQFTAWIGGPPEDGSQRTEVQRKVWCVPLEDGTIAFHIPRKSQIGYSRLEQGRSLCEAIRILEGYVDGPMRVESFGWFVVKWDELDDDGRPIWKGKLLMTRPHLGMYGKWAAVKKL